MSISEVQSDKIRRKSNWRNQKQSINAVCDWLLRCITWEKHIAGIVSHQMAWEIAFSFRVTACLFCFWLRLWQSSFPYIKSVGVLCVIGRKSIRFDSSNFDTVKLLTQFTIPIFNSCSDSVAYEKLLFLLVGASQLSLENYFDWTSAEWTSVSKVSY